MFCKFFRHFTDALNICRDNCIKGTCTKEGDTYKCTCNTGYEGEKCDLISWCEKNKVEVCGGVDCDFDNLTNSGYCKCPPEKPNFNAKDKVCEGKRILTVLINY